MVREGLRLLQEKQAQSKLKMLQQLIKEGEDSGIATTWNIDEFLTRMDAKTNDTNS